MRKLTEKKRRNRKLTEKRRRNRKTRKGVNHRKRLNNQYNKPLTLNKGGGYRVFSSEGYLFSSENTYNHNINQFTGSINATMLLLCNNKIIINNEINNDINNEINNDINNEINNEIKILEENIKILDNEIKILEENIKILEKRKQNQIEIFNNKDNYLKKSIEKNMELNILKMELNIFKDILIKEEINDDKLKDILKIALYINKYDGFREIKYSKVLTPYEFEFIFEFYKTCFIKDVNYDVRLKNILNYQTIGFFELDDIEMHNNFNNSGEFMNFVNSSLQGEWRWYGQEDKEITYYFNPLISIEIYNKTKTSFFHKLFEVIVNKIINTNTKITTNKLLKIIKKKGVKGFIIFLKKKFKLNPDFEKIINKIIHFNLDHDVDEILKTLTITKMNENEYINNALIEELLNFDKGTLHVHKIQHNFTTRLLKNLTSNLTSNLTRKSYHKRRVYPVGVL